MAHRGKGWGRSDPLHPLEHLKSQDAQVGNSPALEKRSRVSMLLKQAHRTCWHHGWRCKLFLDKIGTDSLLFPEDLL